MACGDGLLFDSKTEPEHSITPIKGRSSFEMEDYRVAQPCAS